MAILHLLGTEGLLRLRFHIALRNKHFLGLRELHKNRRRVCQTVCCAVASHWPATALKPLTDNMNDIVYGFSSVFFWLVSDFHVWCFAARWTSTALYHISRLGFCGAAAHFALQGGQQIPAGCAKAMEGALDLHIWAEGLCELGSKVSQRDSGTDSQPITCTSWLRQTHFTSFLRSTS